MAAVAAALLARAGLVVGEADEVAVGTVELGGEEAFDGEVYAVGKPGLLLQIACHKVASSRG